MNITTSNGILIGGRVFNGTNVVMFQRGARLIVIEFMGTSQEFVGNADNAHLDEIWALCAEMFA